MIRLDIVEGVAGHRASRNAVHHDIRDPVARGWGNGKALVGALGDCDRARWRDAAIRPGCRRDGIFRRQVFREAGGDAEVGGDVGIRARVGC